MESIVCEGSEIKKAQQAAAQMVSSVNLEESARVAMKLLCEATGMDSSAVALLDPTKRRLLFFSSYGTSHNYMNDYDEVIGNPPGHAPLENIALHKLKQVTVSDTLLKRYRDIVDKRTIEEGIRCLVLTPLVVDNNCIGLMWMGRYTPGNPNIEQKKAFEQFRNYVSLPLLISQQLTRLKKVSDALSNLSNSNLSIFEKLVDYTATLTESEVACFALLDKPTDFKKLSGRSLRWVATLGCSPEYHKDWIVQIDRCPAESRAFKTERVQTIQNISPDTAKHRVDEMTLKEGLRSHCCAPLIVTDNEGNRLCIGILYCSNYVPHNYTTQQQEVLALLADRAAIILYTQRLLKTNMALDVLGRGIRHTLFGAISRLSTRLRNIGFNSKQSKEAVSPIQAVAENLSKFSRLEAYSVSTPLLPIINEATKDFLPTIVWKCPTSVTLFADPIYLTTVLVDILSNAREHRSLRSKVIMTIKAKGERIIIEVFNKGKHIEKNILESLGKRFVDSDKGEGHGVGICFASQLISMQKGILSYENVTKPSLGVLCKIELISTAIKNRRL